MLMTRRTEIEEMTLMKMQNAECRMQLMQNGRGLSLQPQETEV